jgi:hypothetical protein
MGTELQTVKYTMKNIIIFTLVPDTSIFSLTLTMEAVGSFTTAYVHKAELPEKKGSMSLLIHSENLKPEVI